MALRMRVLKARESPADVKLSEALRRTDRAAIHHGAFEGPQLARYLSTPELHRVFVSMP